MATIEKTRKDTDNTDASIGVALRDLRENQDISARQLSDDSGISPAMISRIESGQVSPSIATMSALSEALDVPLASLFRDVSSERTDFTHVKKGQGVVSTRMMGDHIHHYVNLAAHRRRDLNFEAHLVTVKQQDCPPPVYVSHGVVFIHVLGGSAVFKYGRQAIELNAGDSLSVDAELTHGVSDVLTDEFVFLSVQAEARR
ncbi:MAG: helix-turn-helix domain-containing protein [Pseudomonadota bacterium]